MPEYVWRTLTSGKKVKLDENGTVVAGLKAFIGKNVSQCGEVDKTLRKYSKPEKQYSDYIDAKDMRNPKKAKKAAHKYFNDNLRNTYVDTRVGRLGQRDIHFTGSSWEKLQMDMHKDALKAALIEDMPSILMARNYSHSAGKGKGRDDYDEFHYFVATVRKVDNNGVLRDVRVKIDVGQRQDSEKVLEVYHMSHDKKNKRLSRSLIGLPRAEALAATVGKSRTQAADSQFVEDNIKPFCEVVNMEILDRGGFGGISEDLFVASVEVKCLIKALQKIDSEIVYGK